MTITTVYPDETLPTGLQDTDNLAGKKIDIRE